MITIKTKEEIEKIRKANQIVAFTLNELSKIVKPGITTIELDRLAEKIIRDKGATPAFKGYRGFPASLCASVNEEVVHGIPKKRKLKEGDIISLDLGSCLNGYYGDAAITLPVGRVDEKATLLMRVTKEALYKGIEKARVGNHLYDISFAIQQWAESHGFSVVRDFVGHGIGRQLHEDPKVPNYGLPNRGPLLKEGMVIAIEPMINEGRWEVKVLNDGWTVVTIDGKRSAHFEHTIAITNDGPKILSELNKK
ncbi:MAG: type I methionyl aminopeptidase [Spirochaetes bacterium]|nr:type I methionyl aminopeptidase [Deltaproteobacteria bacterium]RKY00493.1 MAG: type I methionyl aminopeptidase [Spirochaetota bacterium]